jgi:glutamyl-tRNA reductase
LGQLWADACGVPLADFVEHSYLLADEEAVGHLLRVAAGLDSLVLGEPQILGQVTDAYMTAVSQHSSGPVLDALFKSAIRTGKRVRTETAISSNPASVSSVSIALAQRVLGDLGDKRTLVLGVGEMGKLALKALGKRGIMNVSVVNRTREKAETAVVHFNGQGYGLDELCQAIGEADVLIAAANTLSPIVDITTIAARKRPLVIVDIAVPRNVDTAVANLANVHLFDVDNLQATLDESWAARQAEVPQVEGIIAEERAKLNTQLRELTVKPLIVDMRRKADQIREAELERTLRHLGELDAQTLAHIQHFSRSLVNKLLHEPTLRLKEKASENAADDYAATVRDLFGLVEGF